MTTAFEGRAVLRRGLEVFALSGFAITQPLLSVFGLTPDIFIFRDATKVDIVAFALLVTLVPAIAIVAVEAVAAAVSRRAGELLHLAVVASLVGLLTIQVCKRSLGLTGGAALAIGLAVGVVVAVVYWKIAALGLFLRYASPAPLLFAALFLFSSSVSPLVWHGDVAVAKLGSKKDAPSVVFVNFDEWPTSSVLNASGEVDAAQFPNIARLAQMSTFYRNATSVTTSTWYAIPTILSGTYPQSDQIPEASSYPHNLFTFLGGTHKMQVYEAVARLCPQSLCKRRANSDPTGLGSLLEDASSTYQKMVSPNEDKAEVTAGFQEAEDVPQASDIDAPKQQASGSKSPTGESDLQQAIQKRPERFDQFLSSFRRNEKPTLHYLHILLPHVPYRFLPSGQGYAPPVKDPGRTDDLWTDQPWPPTLAHERMLLQVAYTDRLIGELLEKLSSTGLLKSSVMVVTADHGISFTPGQPVRGLQASPPVQPDTYSQLLWSPLFVKASGEDRGSVSDANVISIDVLPTVAKLIGLPLPWRVDGVVAGTRKSSTKVFMKATLDSQGTRIAPPVRFDGMPYFEQMLAQNVDAITEPGDPSLRLWRMRGFGELVGSRVADLTVGTSFGSGVILDQTPFTRVNPAGQLPVLVTGITAADANVAVAVNGTIGGVSPTFREENLKRVFSVVVPDSLLHSGANDVRFYAVTGPSGAPVLRPMGAVNG